MKKQKKHITPKRKSSSPAAQGKRFKGAIDAGTVYGVLLLAIVLGGAYMMLGNIAPNLASPNNDQPVIIQGPNDKSVHSNLQLKDFPGVTLTPTPTPSPSPTPTPTPVPPAPAGGGGGGGGGGGSTCLVAGTKILMADGKTKKNIEDIKPGDKVMGYDTVNKQLKVETVLATDHPIRDHHYNVKLADGTIIGLTREHPLYSEKGWASIDPASTLAENPKLVVAKLNIGDKLLEASGKYVTIVSMQYIPGNIQTYNLKNVTGYNDFVANGIITHNKGGGGGGGGGSGGGGGGIGYIFQP
jgi:hypothetical protein